MTRGLSILVGGTVAFWAAVVLPACLLWKDSLGEMAVSYTILAAILCLVPAAGTLAWSHKALGGQPEQQLVAVLGGTGLRMAFVVGTGLAVYHLAPGFHAPGFMICVVVCYLFTLALEMTVLLTRSPAPRTSRSN